MSGEKVAAEQIAELIELLSEYIVEDSLGREYLVRGGHVRMNGGLEFVYSSV